MATKKAVGRPPKYKSKEEIEEKIDAYFKQCEAVIIELSREKGVYEHDNTCEGKGGSVCRRTAL